MAKKKQHIDDLFKGAFKGSEQPLDGTEWGRLMDELHPKKKRRFAWWWFGAPLVIIAGGLLAWYMWGERNASPTTPVSSPPVALQAPEAPATVEQPTDDLEIESSSTVTPKEVEALPTKEVPNAPQADLPTPSTNNENAGVPDKIQQTSAPTSTENNARDSSVSETNTPDVQRPEILIEDDIRVQPKRNVLLTIPFPALSDSAVEFDNVLKRREIKGLFDPYVGVQVGLNQWQNNITSQDQTYVDYRQLNESPAGLPSLGIQYGGQFKKWQLATGLDYTGKGQNTAGTMKYLIYDSIPKVDLNGDTTWLPWNYRDTTTAVASDLRFNYVTIPFSLGKRIKLNGPVELQLGVTGQLQVLAGARGASINANYTLARTQQLSAYKRLTYTYGGYLGASVMISDQFRLSLMTRYTADGMSMFKNATISQRLSAVGGQIGLQYKLRP